jgi:hypothetical protein
MTGFGSGNPKGVTNISLTNNRYPHYVSLSMEHNKVELQAVNLSANCH